MLVHVAEQSYQQGLEQLVIERTKEALAFFSGAIEIEQRFGASRTQPRYLSYYGLTLSLTGGSPHEAVRCCRMAVRQEGYDPDLCWNLGRVLRQAGRKREAYRALRRGLRLQRDHRGIIRELRSMGIRRRPVVPFLSRGNRINVLLGRLRNQAA